jgi:hypothetical protein
MNLLIKIILESTHNFKRCGILKLDKFKIFLKIISKSRNFKSHLPHISGA